MKQRLEYIDILRGFAIFLVVLGHVLEHAGLKDGFVFHLIYSFHMPLFICISGFVTAYVYHSRLFIDNIYKTGWRFMLRKFNAIMVPYLLWSLVVSPFFFRTYHAPVHFERIIRAALIENTSYWFLPCLFGLLTSYTIYKMVREYWGISKFWQELSVITIMVVVVESLYYITGYDMLRSVISYYLPFWVGIFLGQYGRFGKMILSNSTLFATCLVIFCFIEGLFVGRMESVTGKILRLITGLLALPIMFYLAKNLTFPRWIAKNLSLIGRNTLGIYVIHSFFLNNLMSLNQGNVILNLLGCTMMALAIIGVCMLIICILSLNVAIKRGLLGTH